VSQAQLQRSHFILPSVSAPVQAPPYGAGPSSPPQYVLSPIAPATGAKTTGFKFMVAADSVSSVKIWERDPHTQFWGLLVTYDAAFPNALAPFVWASVCDILASEIWFETDAANSSLTPLLPGIILQETSG